MSARGWGRTMLMSAAFPLLLAATPALAQKCVTSETLVQLTLQESDEVRRTFEAVVAEVRTQTTSAGWGRLTNPAQQAAYQTLVEHVRVLLRLIGERRAPERELLAFGDRFRAMLDYVDAIYSAPPLPPRVNRCVAPLTSLLLRIRDARSDEYFRRFGMKYGPSSERLNFAELAIMNIAHGPQATGAERYPSPWEVILREQSVGYQYYTDTERAKPSSPISQLGLTFYFLGESKLERKLRVLNHVGIAAAYERDLITGDDLWGAMLHVWRVDIGLLSGDEAGTVLASSVNVQLVRKVF